MLEESVTGVKIFYSCVIWGTALTTIVCLTLNISPPYIISQSPQQWKDLYLRSGKTFYRCLCEGNRHDNPKCLDSTQADYLITRLVWLFPLLPYS